MSIDLQPDERLLRADIVERMKRTKQLFSEHRLDDEVSRLLFEMGELAHQLHTKLTARGIPPKHHAYMIRNRDMEPDHAEFYMHVHPIEDLLAFIENPNANDDPEDQTLGDTFTFRVFSHRWQRNDTYRIKRISTGWDVSHIMINGPCDKGGRPFLFRNFDQDSIRYPSSLPDNLEWLWEKAAAEGLSHEQVQDALQQLADWVSKTEKTSPKDGVWEGF
jgi:hypothetical protein